MIMSPDVFKKQLKQPPATEESEKLAEDDGVEEKQLTSSQISAASILAAQVKNLKSQEKQPETPTFYLVPHDVFAKQLKKNSEEATGEQQKEGPAPEAEGKEVHGDKSEAQQASEDTSESKASTEEEDTESKGVENRDRDDQNVRRKTVHHVYKQTRSHPQPFNALARNAVHSQQKKAAWIKDALGQYVAKGLLKFLEVDNDERRAILREIASDISTSNQRQPPSPSL